MKFSVMIFFLLIGCAVIHPVINSNSQLPVSQETAANDTRKKTAMDPLLQQVFIPDTLIIPRTGELSVKDFGAKCDGVTDDFIADSTAFAFAIAHPKLVSKVLIPIGTSRISRPIWLHPTLDEFFTIDIEGMLPAKEASNSYLSQILCDYKSGFGIGISGGRGIIIKNLSIVGRYTPPKVTSANIGILKWKDWNDPTITDSRYAPYTAISVDPYPGYPGTSGVEVNQCRLVNWVSGIALSPGGGVNDDMVNLIDNDIEQVKISYVVCQDQNKEINIIRPKCAAASMIFLDCINYGAGTGGDVSVQDGCLAGAMNSLINARTDRFNITFTGIKIESLFRIGYSVGGAGSNYINCRIDFLSHAGWPEPDYIFYGNANFYGGMLRYYDGSKGHRINYVNMQGMFRDLTLGDVPIVRGLIAYPNQLYPTPNFDNVWLYNEGKVLKQSFDTTIVLPRGITIIVDSIKWVSKAYAHGLGSIVHGGDYILGGPASGFSRYHDQFLNPNTCPTIQIGEVQSISGDTVYMNHVGLNAARNNGFDNIFLSRLK
jgi:hypothetical protein